MEDVVMVFDCGSTNLRVAAVDEGGEIVAQSSLPNRTKPQPGGKPDWRVWDLQEIWDKLCRLSREVLKVVEGRFKPVAATVTTWGADGVLVRRDGTPTYPPISWQCPRTRPLVEEVKRMMDPWEIFRITGYQVLAINTLLKLIWIRRNAPDALEEAYTWVMMPGYISYKLTGEFHIEPTSASTMMAMDLGKRDWSPEMLGLAGLDPGFFPEWREPGEVLGHVSEGASRETGLPEGLPVVVGGHDTQFAIMAAGSGEGEAVLSSGTWEILGLRLGRFDANRKAYELGIIIEADVERGLWNPQFLMIASAVLERFRRLLYPESFEEGYEVLVRDAEAVPPGSEGVMVLPSFVGNAGPTGRYGVLGAVLGLTLSVGRAHIYRAVLEGLSYQFRLALEGLEEAFGLGVDAVRVVGGGSKNMLWNQIRADVARRRIVITRFKEATVLGAALTAFTGAGKFKNLREALRKVDWGLRSFEPTGASELYEKLYRKYLALYPALKPHYSE